MDVAVEEIAIFTAGVVAAVIVVVVLMKHRMRRRRWCLRPTVTVEHLPGDEGEQVRRLIREEGMPGEPENHEVCPKCKRVYDSRWLSDDRPLRQDWERYDRQCACGCDLSRPAWIVDTDALKSALRGIPPEIMAYIERKYGREALHERLYSSVSNDHILFV